MVLGVYTRALYRTPARAIRGLRSELGAVPQIAMYYQDWNEQWATALINPAIVDPLRARDITPMITWQPSPTADALVSQPGCSLAAIAAGALDGYLLRAAHEAAEYRAPLFVRLAPEMNGDWYCWGARPGNSPALYVAMWRHVVSIFRAAGASNVRWVWSPNVVGASAAPFDAYYPGDAWVNDVGLDGYNWGPVHHVPWLSFAQVFEPSYLAMTALTREPLLITETASTELGGDKAQWITGIPRTLATQMPRVRAIVWFDVDKETDWSFDSSRSSMAAFRHVIRSGAFSSPVSALLADSVTTPTSPSSES